MSIERPLTIADGLTRLKIIKKQLATLANDIARYSAWNNKTKHPLGDNKASQKTTLDQAQEEINSKYQSYMDLIEEFKNIKKAVDYTNLKTTITVAGKTITNYESLIYLKQVKPFYDTLNDSFNAAIGNASYSVDSYNSKFIKTNLDEDQKKVVLADVSYFIDKNKIKKINEFNDEFLINVNGKLNSSNAVTEVIWPKENKESKNDWD